MNDVPRTACPRCGHQEQAGLRFCTECGQSLVAPPAAVLPAGPPAQPPGTPTCVSCREPLTPGLRFCTNCGTPIGSAAVPSQLPPPPPSAPPTVMAPMVPPTAPGYPPFADPPSKRRRWPWVAAVLVLLAVAAGGGYAFLTRDDDNGSSDVATDRRTSEDDSSAEPTDSGDDSGAEATDPADESDEPSGAETPSATATPSQPVPPGATCWDGSTTTSVELCSRPQGLAGLNHVFPSMAGQACTTQSGSAPGRKLLVQCFDYLQDGTEIRINYSQWASVSAAIEHYEGKGLVQTLAANGINTFSGYANTGELNNAWIYQKEPYSASVYAPDQAGMTQALSTLVVGVLPDEVRGNLG